MDQALELLVHIDGAARGNPGPAAWAYVIFQGGNILLEHGERLPRPTTNNVAEYTALVKALEKAAELRATVVKVRSDSELLVKQMNGQYRVKNENLLALYQEARRLSQHFADVSVRHVYREQNQDADRLCNEALDGRASEPVQAKRATTTAAPGPAASNSWDEAVARAERLLEENARTWIKSGRKYPPPREVLQEILDLLRTGGFLKAPVKGKTS
jgi:ribonuclease HI